MIRNYKTGEFSAKIQKIPWVPTPFCTKFPTFGPSVQKDGFYCLKSNFWRFQKILHVSSIQLPTTFFKKILLHHFLPDFSTWLRGERPTFFKTQFSIFLHILVYSYNSSNFQGPRHNLHLLPKKSSRIPKIGQF